MMSQSSPEAKIRGYFCSYSPQLMNFRSMVALISALSFSLILAKTSSLSTGRSPIRYMVRVTGSEVSGFSGPAAVEPADDCAVVVEIVFGLKNHRCSLSVRNPKIRFFPKNRRER